MPDWPNSTIHIPKPNQNQLARATRACARGVPVALSPEGTRSKSGQLMRFKKGPFYVQAEAGAIITPLVVLGNYELWPPNYYFTCPGQVVMRYLPPIDAGALPERVRGSKEELSRYGAWRGVARRGACCLSYNWTKALALASTDPKSNLTTSGNSPPADVRGHSGHYLPPRQVRRAG